MREFLAVATLDSNTVRLLAELRNGLDDCRAVDRKAWANRIIEQRIPLAHLMALLHEDGTTAQRFMWLIGDLLADQPETVRPCVPLLFELRDQMPFPGMERTVAKCLWLAVPPSEITAEAIDQLADWMTSQETPVSVLHYASKALFNLCRAGRFDSRRLESMLDEQTRHPNASHAKRMAKLRDRTARLP